MFCAKIFLETPYPYTMVDYHGNFVKPSIKEREGQENFAPAKNSKETALPCTRPR
jgi:hypothetical protein